VSKGQYFATGHRSCSYSLLFVSARNVISAVLKRLAHRNPNVQLYSLTLTESLSKNCGKELHTEIASRAFTQTLERLITDRVRRLLLLPAPLAIRLTSLGIDHS
jgi:VHS domain